MLLELQQDIIYGPVQSRRLGSSLGINLLPTGMKVCTFNCVYCQYGWTDYALLKNAPFPSVDDVLHAVEEALQALPESPSYITFSGNGEPTLHPQFPEIVEGVKDLRDRLAPSAKTAILSNSSRVSNKTVCEALEQLDVRIMKLDAGRVKTFETYNQPFQGIFLDDIIDSLSCLDHVTVQALFTGGKLGNFRTKHLSEWIEKLKRIKPVDVHVYTLDRDCPSDAITKLTWGDLQQIQSKGNMHGIPISIF
jgi:wyosine [tRNA(Phe)-imidazoG37] synthetase (radical SAM superfamily)